MVINAHSAKTHLSHLLQLALAGEEIIIAKAGRPVVKLVPIHSVEGRVLGRDSGAFFVPEDFDAPLPDDILEAFEH